MARARGRLRVSARSERAARATAREFQRKERETVREAIRLTADLSRQFEDKARIWRADVKRGGILRRSDIIETADAILKEWGEAIGAIVRREARTGWQQGMERVLAPLDAVGVRVGRPRLTEATYIDAEVAGALEDFLDGLVGKTTPAKLALVRSTLQRAISAGEDMGKIVNDVADLFGAGMRWDAERLVQTAVAMAQDQGAEAVRDALAEDNSAFTEIMGKEWFHSGQAEADGGRPGHIDLDGEAIKWDEVFVNSDTGAELRYSHDPAAPLGETINCACRTVDIIFEGADLSTLAGG